MFEISYGTSEMVEIYHSYKLPKLDITRHRHNVSYVPLAC